MTTPDNTDSFDDPSYDMACNASSIYHRSHHRPLANDQRARSPRFFNFGRKRLNIFSMIIDRKVYPCFLVKHQ